MTTNPNHPNSPCLSGATHINEIHINPKFKYAHINPNFLNNHKKKPVQISPTHIHVNPKFLNNATSQILSAPPSQVAAIVATPYSTNYLNPETTDQAKAKLITKSNRKIVRQPFPCTSTTSIAGKPPKTFVSGIRMIKIGKRKLINPNISASAKTKQCHPPVQSIFKIHSPGQVYHKVSPMKIDRLNRPSVYKIDRRHNIFKSLDRSFPKSRNIDTLYENLSTTRVKISDYKILRKLVF